MAAGVMDSAAMVMIMRSTLGFGSDDGSGEWRMANGESKHGMENGENVGSSLETCTLEGYLAGNGCTIPTNIRGV